MFTCVTRRGWDRSGDLLEIESKRSVHPQEISTGCQARKNDDYKLIKSDALKIYFTRTRSVLELISFT